jgi:hypothetical protein
MPVFRCEHFFFDFCNCNVSLKTEKRLLKAFDFDVSAQHVGIGIGGFA